ncbi:MAG: hypothetical protein ACLPZR_21390 [Solirubrobacteraceae bacterium]
MLSGAGAKLDDPVRAADQLDVVLDDDDRVSVGDQGGDRGAQPLDVAGMKAHRGLVENVEHPGRVGAHGGGQLDALALAG